MSAQRLNARNIRKITATTGLPVIRAWGHGGYTHDFVTAGHLHGWYNLKSGDWGIQTYRVAHYDTCPGGSAERHSPADALFPDGVPPLTVAEARALLDAKADKNVVS
jgi:hypothetical protein